MQIRIHTISLALAVCLPLSASLSVADTNSVASRLAAQNALFEEQYQADLKASPLTATSYGDYRYNDQLDDASLAEVERDTLRTRSSWRASKPFRRLVSRAGHPLSPTSCAHSGATQRGLLLQRFRDAGLADDGPHTYLADLPLSSPFSTVKYYEDYIARLHQIPRVFTQTEEVLRAGMKDHLMPVRFLLEKIPGQCDGVIASDPFLIPTKKYPSSISAADQQRLTKQITEVVKNEVLPAYKAFGNFVATEYAPHGRTTLSITSLPGGEARYRHDIRSATTVSNLTPDQIHQLGLKEVDRIGAEMLAIAHQQGFPDVVSFSKSLKTNPKYVPTSAEQILDGYRRYIGQMQGKLPQLFTYIPGAPVTVEAIPPFQSAMATHYQPGTPDGKRPGRVVVSTSDFAHRTLVNDEATAYHEGIPGHHMQISVAQEMTGLPKFRQHSFNSGYVEGWALYAEQLGKEVGFYQDPVSDYGRLASERFRAVRLVVDTGIHAKGWTRDQVVDYFRKSGTIDEPMIQSETDRYIAWPAQALSYKLGQIKFLELRSEHRRN